MEQKINIMNKQTICAIPWIHLNIEPNGKVIPCCLTSHHNYFIGDLNTDTVEEIWNSNNMKTLRKQMINGEEPKICSTCFNKERDTSGSISARIHNNREFKKVIEIIPDITLEDGTCTTMDLKYWDFRFSNLCNFKCRSCGPRYSSAWIPDGKKLGYTDKEAEKVWSIEAVDNKTNYDFIADQIGTVEKIYFAGGEPLLMPEHWTILEMLTEQKRFDVKIHYNTNMSVLTYGKKSVLDYWKQWEFGKIQVWPSIDEIGDRAEIIRSGTVWPKVEANLIELSKYKNVIIRPGITVGAWNVNRLPEIINHLIDIGVISAVADANFNGYGNYNNFFINVLQQPSHYNVQILPDEYRQQTIEKLKKFVSEHNAKYDTDINWHLEQILVELDKPHNPDSAQRFLSVTSKVNSVREEDMLSVIPELKIIDEMYPGIYK